MKIFWRRFLEFILALLVLIVLVSAFIGLAVLCGAQPLLPTVAAIVRPPAPPVFALYLIDENGNPTNRTWATNYSVALPVVPFRTYRAVVARASGASESDYSPELSFVSTNSSVRLAWSEPLFLSLYLQTNSGAAGSFTDLGGRFLVLTNPADAMQWFRLRVAVSNAP